MKALLGKFSILHNIRKRNFAHNLTNSFVNKPRFFNMSLPFPVALRSFTHASLWIAPNRIEPEITRLIQSLCSFINNSNPLLSFYDIGANIGWHAWNCLAYTKDVPIHIFEPDESNIILLKKTINQSNLKGISVHSIALSDKDCEAYFQIDSLTSATGTLEKGEKTWIEQYLGHKPENKLVKCRSLDNLIYDMTNPGVIKMDVEGHEESVLKGAQLTIKKNLPALVVESFPPKRKGISTMIENWGYQTLDAETLDVITKDTTNILALHPENNAFPHPVDLKEQVFA
tara:strand:- start:1232 stop:2089 length:858 start_codon:yes stop_codon:yes gene_type:complete